MAASYLECRGYSILTRNWRSRKGELDLVCSRDGELLVFVEVKTRTESDFEIPGQALTIQKKRKLLKTASHYLSRNNLWSRPCRFDLLSVSLQEQGCVIRHDLDVISSNELGSPVGGSHSHWQPW